MVDIEAAEAVTVGVAATTAVVEEATEAAAEDSEAATTETGMAVAPWEEGKCFLVCLTPLL